MVEKSRTTESMILEAAERQFLEKGFAQTSTTEIAKEAGCNQALVNYYYRTKEKLFASIFERKFKLLFSSLQEPLESDLSFRQKLTILLEKHFDMLEENPRVPFLVINELSLNPKRIQALKEQLMQYPLAFYPGIEKELRKEIESGAIREISLFDLLMTAVTLNVSLFLARPILKELLDLEDAALNDLIHRRKAENITTILTSLYGRDPL